MAGPTFLHGKNSRVVFSNPSQTSQSFLGVLASGSNVVTIVSNLPATLPLGATVTGTGIPSNTTVTAITQYTLTLSANATSSSSLTAPTLISFALSNGASFDVSQFFNDVSVATAVDPVETTTFQNSGVKTYISGLKEGTVTLAGFYDGSYAAVDEIMANAINNSADEAVLVFPDGGTAQNSVCHLARGLENKYDLKTPVAGVVAIDTEIVSDGGVWRGFGQYFTTTSSGSTTAKNNGLQTTRGGLLIINVLALQGTLSLSFQHSANNVTYQTISGSTISTVGNVVLFLPNPLLQYTQLIWTLSGTSPSATICYGFARF